MPSVEVEGYGRMNVLQERGRDAVNVRPHGTGRLVPMLPHLTPEQRFWSKVNKDGHIPAYAPELGACWLWTGTINNDGYGKFSVRMKTDRAARWAYERWCGPIRDGHTIDHLCRNRPRVRLSHLESVTNRENILRSEGLTAQNARKTHCPKGHPYSSDNLYVNPQNGSRHCRTCVNAMTRRWAARNIEQRMATRRARRVKARQERGGVA